MVVASFWVLYHIDRNLVYPTKMDSIYPAWHNHVKHSLPLIACVINNILIHHKYQKFSKGAFITLIAGASYLTWIFYIGYTSNHWVYGVLAKLDHIGRALFFIIQLTFLTFAYRQGEIVNRMIWGIIKTNKLKKVD
jgi:hypothetical protein